MSRGTPHRPIRMSDELWAKAQEKAKRLGTTASEKARELLAAWVEMEEYHPTMSDPYTTAGAAHIANCPQCQQTFS